MAPCLLQEHLPYHKKSILYSKIFIAVKYKKKKKKGLIGYWLNPTNLKFLKKSYNFAFSSF